MVNNPKNNSEYKDTVKFKFKHLIILLNIIYSPVYSSETDTREAMVTFWIAAENAARILALPATYTLGVLTGCGVQEKSDTIECPDILIDKYKQIKDHSLKNNQILNLISKCSPKSQGFPENNLNAIESSLTDDCNEALIKVIPWKDNFDDEQVDTSNEIKLKNAFLKGIWGVLFLQRSYPSAYSTNGEICPSLERNFFGSHNERNFSYEKWYNGELIQTEILDILRTMGTQIGFQENNKCNKKNPVYMYYDSNTETLGLCRTGAAALLGKSMFYISSTIIHQTRHSSNLFGLRSAHDSDCSNGDINSCDEGEFGSYGSEFIYADQIITGSIQILKDLPSESTERKNIFQVIQSALSVMCESNKMIFYTEHPLYASIESIRPCKENKKIEFLKINYGVTEEELY